MKSFLCAMLLALPSYSQAPAGDPPVPFAEFADGFRKAHHIEVSDGAGFDAPALLARDWVGERLGVVDLLYPRAGLEAKPRQEELRGVAACVIDLQALWLEWFGNGEAAVSARADLLALKKWIAGAKFQSARLSEPSLGLLAVLAAGEKELAAAARAAAAFEDGSALGYKPRGEVRWKVMVAPTRKEFLDLVAFFGWADPDNRASFWDNGAARWSECYWNQVQVLSLEDPPGKPNPASPWEGVTMNLKAPTGVVEHVATRAAHTLCTTFFGYTLEAAFESGLAQNTAIALYGRNNSRSGGSGRGNSVDGWSMFIPGGSKHGGHLPGFSADSPWRGTAGADWFVKPLKDSQRVASKDASRGTEKTSTFELTATDNVKKHFVRAPFLGRAAETQPVPSAEFLPDYREFFRAYKSCFVHWLFEEAGGKSAKLSHAKLAELLRSVATAAEGANFEDLLAACYGMAWSGPEAKPESLEWNFLSWLSRQK
jgi:hypothetical protein